MPYVKNEFRLPLKSGKMKPMESGHLNYLITMEIISLYDALKEADYVVDLKPFKDKVMKLCLDYCENHHLKYQIGNDVMGAITGALHEFKNRTGGNYIIENALLEIDNRFYLEIMRPYEDRKIKENGDCYKSIEV